MTGLLSPVNPACRTVTDYKEFPGRTHFLIGQTGWQEIAGYILGWLRQRLTTPA